MNRADRSRFKTARPRAQLRRGRTDWYRISNQASSNTAEVFIMDEIGYFGVTAGDFVNDLRALDVETIELHLNTPGGEVFDGIAIYNALRDHEATVNVTVDGLAASIGSVIAMAGDAVTMNRSSQLMIHEGHGVAIGDAAVMRDMAALLDRTSGEIASVYADRAGGEIEEWRERMRAETWYSADEAVEAGLADRVNGADATENSWDLSIFAYAGRDRAPVPEIAGRGSNPDPAPVPRPRDEGTTDTPSAFKLSPDWLRDRIKEATGV